MNAGALPSDPSNAAAQPRPASTPAPAPIAGFLAVLSALANLTAAFPERPSASARAPEAHESADTAAQGDDGGDWSDDWSDAPGNTAPGNTAPGNAAAALALPFQTLGVPQATAPRSASSEGERFGRLSATAANKGEATFEASRGSGAALHGVPEPRPGQPFGLGPAAAHNDSALDAERGYAAQGSEIPSSDIDLTAPLGGSAAAGGRQALRSEPGGAEASAPSRVARPPVSQRIAASDVLTVETAQPAGAAPLPEAPHDPPRIPQAVDESHRSAFFAHSDPPRIREVAPPPDAELGPAPHAASRAAMFGSAPANLSSDDPVVTRPAEPAHGTPRAAASDGSPQAEIAGTIDRLSEENDFLHYSLHPTVQMGVRNRYGLAQPPSQTVLSDRLAALDATPRSPSGSEAGGAGAAELRSRSGLEDRWTFARAAENLRPRRTVGPVASPAVVLALSRVARRSEQGWLEPEFARFPQRSTAFPQPSGDAGAAVASARDTHDRTRLQQGSDSIAFGFEPPHRSLGVGADALATSAILRSLASAGDALQQDAVRHAGQDAAGPAETIARVRLSPPPQGLEKPASMGDDSNVRLGLGANEPASAAAAADPRPLAAPAMAEAVGTTFRGAERAPADGSRPGTATGAVDSVADGIQPTPRNSPSGFPSASESGAEPPRPSDLRSASRTSGPDAPSPAEPAVESASLRRVSGRRDLDLVVRAGELGRVAVRIVERAGRLSAVLRSNDARAAQALSDNVPSLLEALSERGLGAESRHASGAADPDAQQREQQRRHGRRQQGRRRLRLAAATPSSGFSIRQFPVLGGPVR